MANARRGGPFSLLQAQKCAGRPHCAIEITSLSLALAGGWAEAPAPAPALPQPFPLLRGHAVPALGHADSVIGATGAVESKSAEEDPAQQQQPQRLPEADLAPPEERRQQPIPQVQHDFAADEDEYRHPQ